MSKRTFSVTVEAPDATWDALEELSKGAPERYVATFLWTRLREYSQAWDENGYVDVKAEEIGGGGMDEICSECVFAPEGADLCGECASRRVEEGAFLPEDLIRLPDGFYVLRSNRRAQTWDAALAYNC